MHFLKSIFNPKRNNLLLFLSIIILSVSPFQNVISIPIFGTGSDGPLVVSGTVTISSDKNYTDLTINPGAVLEIEGATAVVRVSGTLTNYGTITDSYSGGASGSGGPRSLGGFNSNSVADVGGGGSPGSKNHVKAGNGGCGATGGGGGGRVTDNEYSETARGGNGGVGGAGGNGGGYVAIFANNFDNQSVVHVNGTSGENGLPGTYGQYVYYEDDDGYENDMVGGGGGGGGGGNGGDGGTIEITYATLISTGDIQALGGLGGSLGIGGSGLTTYYGGFQQSGGGGLNSLNCGVAGGHGGHGYTGIGVSYPGLSGDNGISGQPGIVTMTQNVSCCIDKRGNADGDAQDKTDVDDLVYMVDFAFKGGDPVECLEEGDVDASGVIDVDDLVFMVDFAFKGGAAPGDCL